MYGVGQITDTIKKMVVVILFKDKSAQVAIASLGDASGVPIEQSVGEVSYKFVSRIDSMSLKCREELQEFARILVSALKWTLEQLMPYIPASPI